MPIRVKKVDFKKQDKDSILLNINDKGFAELFRTESDYDPDEQVWKVESKGWITQWEKLEGKNVDTDQLKTLESEEFNNLNSLQALICNGLGFQFDLKTKQCSMKPLKK